MKIYRHEYSKENNKALAIYGIEMTEDNGSIFISKVLPDSSAALSGLRSGMEIKAINRVKVESIKDVKKAVKKHGTSVLLYVSDGRSSYFVVLSK